VTNLVKKCTQAIVEVEAPYVMVTSFKRWDFVKMTVEDNGIGIPFGV